MRAPWAGLSPCAAEEFKNQDCLDCHNDPSNVRKVNGKEVPLELFTTNRFEKSVHAKLACVDCHQGIKDLVHDTPLPSPNCITCHDTNATHVLAAKDYANSIHGVSHTLGASGAASCWDCHGSHGILPVKDDTLAGVQAEPAADLREVPQQRGNHQRIPDEVS